METIRVKTPHRILGSSVVSVGVFDGLHIGHKAIIEKVKDESRRKNVPSVIVTFEPHPAKIVNPPISILTTTEEKIRFLSNLSIAPDFLVILEFDRTMAQKSADEFVREYLVDTLGMKTIIEGEDHRFGNSSSGDIDLHRKLSAIYNYEVIVLPTYYVNGYPVKSGKIRELISTGEINLAKELLGHEYFLCGEVIPGDKFGRELGFPTANIQIEPDKLLPPDGVYLVRTKFNGSLFHGLLYIGYRPTITTKKEKRVELNLFDFYGELYGKNLLVEFLARIREDKTFDDVALLRKEMENDKTKALKLLGKV